MISRFNIESTSHRVFNQQHAHPSSPRVDCQHVRKQVNLHAPCDAQSHEIGNTADELKRPETSSKQESEIWHLQQMALIQRLLHTGNSCTNVRLQLCCSRSNSTFCLKNVMLSLEKSSMS
eukprot:3639375-Pleurochrysis_carterae.AAC.1